MNRILAFVFVCLAASYLAAQPAADNASLAAIEGNSETERQAKASVRSVELPDINPVELRPFARLGPGPAKENSGIVKSCQHADVFWMHNDSADEPRIYPIHINGEVYKSERYPGTPGVLTGGAINVDWEEIRSSCTVTRGSLRGDVRALSHQADDPELSPMHRPSHYHESHWGTERVTRVRGAGPRLR